MNEIFMALLSFGLGVFATLFTQVFIRWLKLGDAKRQQQLDSLHQVKSWIESNQILFDCKYPEVRLDKFVNGKPPEDNLDSLFTYQALKTFREASAKCDKEARVGRLALKSLTHKNGLTKTIYPLIESLDEARDDLFIEYPKQWYQVDWDKLEFIEPADLHLIVHRSGSAPNPQEYSNEDYLFLLEDYHRNLRVHQDDLWKIRRDAQYTIERALEEVHKYEKDLLVVAS